MTKNKNIFLRHNSEFKWEILTLNFVTFLKDKMELRMKCFNILVVHEKIKFLGQGSHKKTISREDCLKWQAWNKLYL